MSKGKRGSGLSEPELPAVVEAPQHTEGREPTPDDRAAAIMAGNPLPPTGGGHEGNGKQGRNETKAQRWRRLVCQRMPKILHAMRRLIPLASRAQYEYGEEEVRKVLQALDDARADIGRAFAGQREAPAAFRLD